MRHMTFTETETPNLLGLYDHLTETRDRAFAVTMATKGLSDDDEQSALSWLSFDAYDATKDALGMLATIREAETARRDGSTDPMLALINEYQKQLDIFTAIPEGELTAANEAEHVARTYGPVLDALDNAPAITSTAGVAAALRLAQKEPEQKAEQMIAAALAFLERDPA
jgi:hypothetical protein